MDYAIAALAGVFFTAAVYLLLSRSLIRMLLGLGLIGNAVNLLILVSGRLSRSVPPISRMLYVSGKSVSVRFDYLGLECRRVLSRSFDIGVYLGVFGTISAVALALEDEGGQG